MTFSTVEMVRVVINGGLVGCTSYHRGRSADLGLFARLKVLFDFEGEGGRSEVGARRSRVLTGDARLKGLSGDVCADKGVFFVAVVCRLRA